MISGVRYSGGRIVVRMYCGGGLEAPLVFWAAIMD